MYLKCIFVCALAVLLPALVQAKTAPPSTPSPQPATQPSNVAQPANPAQPANQPANVAQPSNPAQPTTQPGQVARPAPQPGQPGQPGQVAQPTPQPGQAGQVAQPTNQPSTGQTTPFPQALYRMDNVNRALNLSQLQQERLNQMTQGLQDRFRNDFTNLNNLTPQERASRSQQMLQQYNSAWTTGAGNILNQSQMNRYRQLELQNGGFSSLTNNPQVQRQLNLTNDQLQQLNAANQWSQQQVQNLTQQGATDPNRAASLYRDYQAQWQTRLNGILTPQQQQQWQTMTGEPFNFQPSYQQR